MKNIDIAVVILHFNDFDMTRKYIDNLKGLNWGDYRHHFIIVDNHSPDDSGQELCKWFETDLETTVILLPENIGFSRGNNQGIRFAKEKLNADLVVVSNNDIYIKTKEFPSILEKEYKLSRFSVYGPDIYSMSKETHQNPMRQVPLNIEDIHKKVRKIDRILPVLWILNQTGLYDTLKNIRGLFKKKNYSWKPQRIENCVLHGSFFVIDRKYLDKYPEGLFEGTFLYMEEDILAYRCFKEDLKMVYDPSVKIIHFDGISSMKTAGNRCIKFMNEMKETKKSCLSFLNYMKDDQ